GDPRAATYAEARSDRVGSVGELAELGREQIGRLLADVHGAVADALDRARDDDHAQAPLSQGRLGHDVDEALDEAAVGAVDQFVEVDEALRPGEVASRERVERDAEHLLRAVAHLDEDADERRVRVGVGDELGQLRDRDAAVAATLEQQVDVEDGQQQPQVAGDRRLKGEERLDRALDPEEQLVDLVVEGDDLVGELDIPLLERADGSPDGREHPLALLLELRFDAIEVFVDAHRDTVHPYGIRL